MPRLRIQLFIPLYLMTGMACGEESSAISGGALETLLVTGERVQASAMAKSLVIKSASEFMPGPRVDVNEILQGLPGVQVDSRTNLAQDTRISLRGYGARSAFGVRGIDLLVDGVPMTMPDGQGQLSSVMLDQLESVQVVRGPIASWYGNGAGGVIALQTALPDDNRAQIGVALGEHGLQRQQLNIAGRKNNLGGSLAYAQMEQDGERPHARAEREQLGLQLFYENDNDLQIRLKHDLTDDPLLQDPLGLTPEQWEEDPLQANDAAEIFNTRKSVEHQQTSLSLRQAQENWRWQAAAWSGTRAIEQYLGFSGVAISSSGGVVDLEREFGGANASLARDLDFFGRPLVATVGVEWAQMQDHRRGYVNNMGIAGDLRRDEVGDVDAQDGYGILQWSLTDRLDIYTGVRRSLVDFQVDDAFIVPPSNANAGNPDDSGVRDYADTSHASGVRFSINERWSLSTSYGRGFETPTLTEMAYKSEGAGLNTDLEAATNQQYEVGIGYQNTRAEFNFSAFIIDTENELVVDQSLNGRTSYTNAAATRRDGFELFGRLHFTEQWQLQTSITLIDAIYTKGEWDNHQLPGVAREQYQLDLQYLPFSSERLIFSAGVHKRTAIATSDSNEIFAPGFYRIDVAIEGKVQPVKFDIDWWLKVANLTDENYVGSVIVNQSSGRAFEPAPRRSVLGGISIRY